MRDARVPSSGARNGPAIGTVSDTARKRVGKTRVTITRSARSERVDRLGWGGGAESDSAGDDPDRENGYGRGGRYLVGVDGIEPPTAGV